MEEVEVRLLILRYEIPKTNMIQVQQLRNMNLKC